MKGAKSLQVKGTVPASGLSCCPDRPEPMQRLSAPPWPAGFRSTFRKALGSSKQSHASRNRASEKARTTNLGPFGEVLRSTGPIAKANPLRFSTKYQDDETDLLYYGYRYYIASMGRWLSKDPLSEESFWVRSRICGSKWHTSAAGRRVRYALRPAATRAGGSKLVAAARLPAAEILRRHWRQLVTGRQGVCQHRKLLMMWLLHSRNF